MMKNYDESVNTNRSLNWPNIPDHHYANLTIGGQDQARLNCY